jgi:mono/diheme cytochrome c family protein
MNQCIRIWSVLVSAWLLSSSHLACSADAPSGDAANGKRLFVAVGCYECHGRVAEGGYFNYAAPVLAHTPLPLEGFRVLVRMGLNDMPAYKEKVLSDQDVADIHAFLRSLPGPRPAGEFPLLNQ